MMEAESGLLLPHVKLEIVNRCEILIFLVWDRAEVLRH